MLELADESDGNAIFQAFARHIFPVVIAVDDVPRHLEKGKPTIETAQETDIGRTDTSKNR